jgi:acyl-CoA synthetase (AMP-forming)/AMP-acid ligase II
MTGALSDLLGGALAANPQPIESIDGDCVTPTDLLGSADRVCAALRADGVTPNEPVHLRMGNRPADIGALLGTWRAGAVAVPVHVTAASTTKARLAAATKARFVVDGDHVERMAAEPPPPRELLDGAALVMFTSGTTGLPKGTAVAHRRLADKLAVLDGLLSLRPDDVVLLPLQMTFIFGLWVMLLTLRSRARLILVPKFSAEAMARGLREATVMAAVPSAYRALMLEPPPAPRLRMMMTGGEVLPPHLARTLRGRSGASIVDLYGLTETGTCDFCCGPAEQPHGFGSIGRPTPQVAYRIAPDGELQIRSPFGMLGFLDDPALTTASFADDYYKTGDLARTNEHGFVELIGRAKDIVSRGGTKIAPLEVDHLIAEHPSVAAALCAGVPDERLGEVLHAAVVRRDGHELDAATLRAWLTERTERYKVPEAFYFVDALPVGSTGKADRRTVTAMAMKKV